MTSWPLVCRYLYRSLSLLPPLSLSRTRLRCRAHRRAGPSRAELRHVSLCAISNCEASALLATFVLLAHSLANCAPSLSGRDWDSYACACRMPRTEGQTLQWMHAIGMYGPLPPWNPPTMHEGLCGSRLGIRGERSEPSYPSLSRLCATVRGFSACGSPTPALGALSSLRLMVEIQCEQSADSAARSCWVVCDGAC